MEVLTHDTFDIPPLIHLMFWYRKELLLQHVIIQPAVTYAKLTAEQVKHVQRHHCRRFGGCLYC